MKIGFLLNKNIYLESSASANRWKNIMTGLSSTGIEVALIIVGGFNNKAEKRKFNNKSNEIFYLNELVYDTIWKSRLKSYVFNNLLIFLQAKKLQKIAKNLDLDFLFIECTNQVFGVYDFAYKNKTNSFRLVFELNEDPETLAVHAINLLQKKKLGEQISFLNNRVFKEVDYCFFMTKSLLKKYVSLHKNLEHKSYLLPMSVDFARFENLTKYTTNDFYLAYCGSSSFTKDGVDILIKAFEILAQKHPKIKLKIAAFMENDGYKMLKLINDSRSNRIEYVGELSKDDIPGFIFNARVLLLPRPASEQAIYGFPTKLGEYLATGNPVCCTRVGEIDDYLTDRHSVYFAEPSSIYSLVTTLEEIIANPLKARQVGRNGQLMAREYFDKEKQGAFIRSVLRVDQ